MAPAGLFVGLTTFDLIHYVERFPHADEKIQADQRWTGAGGPAANAAMAFSALGGHARLLTAIGQEQLAAAAREDLEKNGVEVVDLAGDASLATSSAVVDSSGLRTVVSMNAKGINQEEMTSRLSAVESVDVVSVDSHYPSVVWGVLACIAEDTPVVFDPGSHKPHVYDLMADCSHVIASRSLDPTAKPESLLARVIERDPVLAAVSAGEGSILAAADGRRFEVPVPKIDARDTVGAGDVLHGAYAYFVGTKLPIPEALTQAAAVAAESCKMYGARVG